MDAKFIYALFLIFAASHADTARADPPLKIGLITPLTGSGSFFGQELRSGMELCREGAFDLLAEDSQTSAAAGVSAFNKLSYESHIDLAIVSFSTTSSAVSPLAASRGIPLILTLVSAEQVVKAAPGSPVNYFTTGEQEGPIMARFARDKLGAQAAAALYLEDEYGQAYKSAFSKAFGGLAAEESFGRESGDFRASLLKLKVKEPDVLYFIGYDKHLPVIVRQAKELGLKSKLITNWVLASPSVREANADILEGVYLSTPDFYSTDRPLAVAFKQRYSSTFNKSPSAYAAIGCDLSRLIAKDAARGREILLQTLRGLNNHAAVMGALTTEQGSQIRFPLYPARIERGEAVMQDY